MLQLIRKDFLIHKNIIIIMFVTISIYMFTGISLLFIGILFASTMAMHIFSSDEKNTARILLSSLPLTRKEIVSSKYISAFLYVLLISIILVINSLIIQKGFPSFTNISLIIICSLLIISFIYPFSYKFSSKYLMFAGIILCALYFLTMSVFIHDINDQIRIMVGLFMKFMEVRFLLSAAIIVLIFYVISWFLSIKIYEKKAL